MAPLLGKRKRRSAPVEVNNSAASSLAETDSQRLQELLRKNFEAAFEPLPNTEKATIPTDQNNEQSADEEEEMVWEGISDTEEQKADIVQHVNSRSTKSVVSREELKMFMTSKPPKPNVSSTPPAKPKNNPPRDPDEANNDAANLKKDLALQRLLKESHLLDQQSSLSHLGQTRHKALDLRLQDMGSKRSIYTQQRMPLAQRKGISAKKSEREYNRRREAQENGIILEKVASGKGKRESKRERVIGAPTVGKFRGGTLQLSKRDVAHIQDRKYSSPRRKQ